MRRCLDTDCRVVWKLSAIACDVIAYKASKVMMARLVGSAIAWKMSRLIVFSFMRNRLAANICATVWFRKFIFKSRKEKENDLFAWIDQTQKGEKFHNVQGFLLC